MQALGHHNQAVKADSLLVDQFLQFMNKNKIRHFNTYTTYYTVTDLTLQTVAWCHKKLQRNHMHDLPLPMHFLT